MRRRGVLGGLAGAAILPGSGFAQTQMIVSAGRALSGDRFMVGETEYHLADVLAPPLHHLNDHTPPYFEQSRLALQTLLQTGIEVEDVGEPTRWGGRIVRAQPVGGDQSIQEQLTAMGCVRVNPQTDDHAFIDRLLGVEREARRKKTGLWALPAYSTFDAENAETSIGGWHLIAGTIRQAEKFGSRFYLNFGEDFKEDFTATAASSVHRKWLKADFDMSTLANARVRVRGFIEAINGPSLDMTHLKQIELLS